jgi:cell division protein FtsL
MKHFPSPNSNEDVAPTPVTHRSSARRLSTTAVWSRRDAEKGAGRLKAILWTLVLAAFVYVAVKVVPVLVNEYQFQDGIQTLARFASVNRQTSEQIRASVLKEAEKDDVDISADDVKVVATNGNVNINVDFSVTVDLGVYQWILNFHPSVSNNAII